MIDIFVQSRYQVDRAKIRTRTISFLKKLGISEHLYGISIAIVGDRKMSEAHRKFAKKTGTTPVLAFPMQESVKDGQREITMIGEIIISYPQAVLFASDENKLVDDKIGEFVEHGIANLLKAG